MSSSTGVKDLSGYFTYSMVHSVIPKHLSLLDSKSPRSGGYQRAEIMFLWRKWRCVKQGVEFNSGLIEWVHSADSLLGSLL